MLATIITASLIIGYIKWMHYEFTHAQLVDENDNIISK